MDEMVINSLFTRKFLSKLIEKSLRKKTGLDIHIELGNTQVKIDNDKARVSLSCSFDIPKDQLAKFVDEAF